MKISTSPSLLSLMQINIYDMFKVSFNSSDLMRLLGLNMGQFLNGNSWSIVKVESHDGLPEMDDVRMVMIEL